MENFYEELADILEVDSVNDNDVLRDFDEWDSLTALSVVLMASDSFNKVLTAEDLAACVTVADLKNIIQNK